MNAAEGARLADAVWRRATVLGWVANLIGAAVVFVAVGFLLAVFFDSEARDQLGRDAIPVVAVAAPTLFIWVTWVLKRRQRTAFVWLHEGRLPTEEEHRQTLGLPGYVAMVTFAGWAIGGLVAGISNLDHSFVAGVLATSAFWLGGETTSALAYLICERTLRPVTARALAARSPERTTAPGVRHRLLFAWSLGTAVPMMSVLLVGAAGLFLAEADVKAVAGACVFLGTVALAVGLLITKITARAIGDPINSVRAAVERVAAGDLEALVAIDDASEVGQLQAGFNRMAEGLRERERIRDLFGRQVGHDVARAALQDGTRLGGEEREVGALYVDLTGSTSMAMAMPPTEVVRLLNKFFRVVIEAVEGEGGFVNKFEGDAALCVFGAPVASADPAGDALRAARTLAERLQREVPEIGFGIGVSAGRAVAGNVGSEQRFEYTVIGDPVNEAARLSDLAKERGEAVLASDAALDRAGEVEAEAWELGERTVLRGRLDATGLAAPRA